jgi:hypothetical protein
MGGMACQGSIAPSDTSSPPSSDPAPDLPAATPGAPDTPTKPDAPGAVKVGDDVYFRTAIRRLSKTELRQTLRDLLGIDLGAEVDKFPEDYGEANAVFAFDNDYGLQQPSSALIEAARNLAQVAADQLLASASARARVVPCTAAGPSDDACLRRFITAFGRRALRRPLAADEVARYATTFLPFATDAGDFNRAVALIVRSLLQHIEFLYRVEIGQPTRERPDLVKLGGYEVASRLSYFLWGSTPDDALLDAAQQLVTPDGIRTAAARMIDDAHFKQGASKFHAMWLGWERYAPLPPFEAAMAAETAALLERVIVREKRPWLDLFRMKETYVDKALAAHYGLPAPASGSAWVPTGMSGRQGILSHGAYLGVERKHEDTSPTMRGLNVRVRLMCQRVPMPPGDVDVDNVVKVGNCKADRYRPYLTGMVCAGCHGLMDAIGNGLENYDRTGAYRTVAPEDQGKTGCAITGEGTLAPVGPFKGVAQLSDLLAQSGTLEACATTQLASYYLGRELDASEQPAIERLAAQWKGQGGRFDQLVMQFVGMPAFGYRVVN